MEVKAKVVVLCVMQCICATLAAFCSDRRRLGGAKREHVNTFADTAFNRAMQSKKTKWFHKKMRCDKRTFLTVVARVRQDWVGNIHHNAKFDITKRVAVSLIYLSTGGTIDSAASLMGMSKSSAVMYINQVLVVLSRMAKQHIVMPTTQKEIDCVREGFEKIPGFPDVIGAVDGSLIRISRPAEHEGWYCRKNLPAVNMQAVVDHKTRFRSYCIRAGSINDQALWNKSGLRNNTLIPSGMHPLGDAGYKIFRHILTPFDEEEAMYSPKKKRYNYKLSQTRITVERAFGILKNRYRVLLGKVQQKTPTNVSRIIVSCLVLHNLMIDLNDTYRVLGTDPDRASVPVFTSLANENELSHAQGLAKQKEIMEYFFTL